MIVRYISIQRFKHQALVRTVTAGSGDTARTRERGRRGVVAATRVRLVPLGGEITI